MVPADRVFSAAEAKGGAAIDASKTALLLVEYQNEFTTEGGKLHDAVKESMAATGMLERSAKLADEAQDDAKIHRTRREILISTQVTLTDCCATTSAEGQAGATGGTFGMFSDPMTADDFVAKL